MTLYVVFDTVTTDSSVAKMTLKTLQKRSIIRTPNHVLTMKSGLVEIIVNAGETTQTLEKGCDKVCAGQVSQLFDQVDAQESKVA